MSWKLVREVVLKFFGFTGFILLIFCLVRSITSPMIATAITIGIGCCLFLILTLWASSKERQVAIGLLLCSTFLFLGAALRAHPVYLLPIPILIAFVLFIQRERYGGCFSAMALAYLVGNSFAFLAMWAGMTYANTLSRSLLLASAFGCVVVLIFSSMLTKRIERKEAMQSLLATEEGRRTLLFEVVRRENRLETFRKASFIFAESADDRIDRLRAKIASGQNPFE